MNLRHVSNIPRLSLRRLAVVTYETATRSVAVDKQWTLYTTALRRHATIYLTFSLTCKCFPTLWKEAAVVPVFNRDNHAAVSNYRPISILNNFSKLFEVIIHDHV
jgi:hypothetical protein